MLDKLKQLGLTEYEARAYLALLKHGTKQGREIAKLSKVPPTRVFDALHSLVNKGFAAKLQDKPLLFRAIPPEEAIKHNVKQQQDELRILQENIIPELKQIKTEVSAPKVTEKINIVSGYEALWSFVEDNLNTAKRELKMMFTYEQRPKGVLSLMKRAISRGVKLKIIATKYHEAGIHLMKEHQAIGAEVRYYPVEELRFTIKDSKESLITLVNPKDKHDRINIIIESQELSRALDNYFDSLWKKAKKI